MFIHCAANYRVSAFIALYRIRSLGWSRERALEDLRVVWKPDDIWSRFLAQQIDGVSAHHPARERN